MAQPPPIHLISAPFGPLRSPSLGLGLLQACLGERSLGARTHYLTLDFARRIGVELYLELTEGWVYTPDQVGEWIFGEALNGHPGDVEGYVREVLMEGHWAHRKTPNHRPPDLEAFVERLLWIREGAGAFLDDWAERLAALNPRVVGFTSVFQQNAASLALAARLKALDPQILTVLGGANAEGAMGETLFAHYPALDLVVSGEAEARFPQAMAAFLERGLIPALPGCSLRPWLQDPAPAEDPGKPDLDAIPAPDFSEYFDQLQASGLTLEASVPFETSRGCWWGAKQHCTFCGLNGETMAFRSKAPERALAQFRQLRDRHPGCEVSVVDNILDMAYFKSFLPALADEGNGAEIFFEVKANLTKDQLRLLKAAGVTRIQPGIESLSDAVLRLMRKGVKAIHCVQLLKWCAELGIQPGWNLLGGFPGEDPEDYARQAALLPALYHLPAPLGCGQIRLDRFSPNFNEAPRLGLAEVQAYPAYGYVYDLPPAALGGLAYHFAFRYADGRDVAAYLDPLQAAVQTWKAERPNLLALDQGDRLMVFDTRPGGRPPLAVLEGAAAWILRACDAVIARQRLARQAVEAGIPEGAFTEALERLEAAAYVMEDDGLCLGLVLGLGDPVSAPVPEATRP